MKLMCLFIMLIILASFVSASSSQKITVSVFVKEKTPEVKASSLSNYLDYLYNTYKIIIINFSNFS